MSPTSKSNLDDLADQAQDGIRSGVREGRRAANRVLDRVQDSADELRVQADPIIDRLTDRATAAAHDGLGWMRENTDRVRTQVTRATDRTVGYVRDQPVRAVLMAAAAGALLYAAVRLFSSSSDSANGRRWRQC
jgi:ElaB/YqjD/DUF883 family membrane-anchored ribosome-binding protein